MALDYLPSPGWAVVYGETPAADRWSELGENDDALATGVGLDDSAIKTRHLNNGAVTSPKIDLPTFTGAMSSGVPTVAGVTVASVTLPSTPTPHQYLVLASFQFNHQANAAVVDYIGIVNLNGTLQNRAQYTNMPNQYTFSVPTVGIVRASSGTLTFVAQRTNSTGGQVLDRSHYSIVDLGPA